MKRKIIIGNWKMHPGTAEEAKRVFKNIKRTALNLKNSYIVVCPPSVYIPLLISREKGNPPVGKGAQNVFFEEQGAYTGEIGPGMLKDLGVTHCIVGHSERRKMGETDEIISKKVQAVLEVGIHPILCVGENVRDSQGTYLDELKAQIKNSLSKVPKKFASQLIIAYEPVWAIGAPEPMDPASIYETSIFIRKILADMYGHDNALATSVLYGGSVNFRNAADILTKGEVDGLLVGRESVNAPGFTELLKAIDVI